MPWVHTDEAYEWMVWTGEEPPQNALTFPEHYRQVSQELADRLSQAWKNLKEVCAEIDAGAK